MEVTKWFENHAMSSKRNNILNEYRKIGKFTDLTLKSTDGKTMTVHKNILSACCSYFEGMFNSNLIETRQEIIQLVDDLTIADLEILIEYIYVGKVKISLENAENIYIKAQYIQLVELQKFCSDFITENIKVENCLNYWRNSIKYLNYNLTAECIKFIKSNCKSFLENNIIKLTIEEFKLLMSIAEILAINQEDLYKFVSIWIKADFGSRNLHLMELITNLDFIKMSDEFIETEIMCDQILQNNIEFVTKMVRITFQKMRVAKKQHSEKPEEKLLTNSKSIFSAEKSENSEEKLLYLNSNPTFSSEKSEDKVHWLNSKSSFASTSELGIPLDSRNNISGLGIPLNSINKNNISGLGIPLNSINKNNCDNSNLKNVSIITNGGIYTLKSNESQWTNHYNFKYVKPWFFATATYKNNIFFSGGWHKESAIASSEFESWNNSSRKINKLGQMIEKRYKHKLVELNGKIYSCGGDKNNGSTEFFDFQNLSWNKGSPMMENKYSFGLITSEDSLYAFGGWKTSSLPSVIVEQFDPREGRWRIISRAAPQLSQAVILSNNSVYCFDGVNGRKIFDLRTNSWTNSLETVFDNINGAQYYVGNCDIVQSKNEIFGVFQTDYSKTWATLKYDYNAKKWSNLNIPLNLSEYYDINLCINSCNTIA